MKSAQISIEKNKQSQGFRRFTKRIALTSTITAIFISYLAACSYKPSVTATQTEMSTPGTKNPAIETTLQVFNSKTSPVDGMLMVEIPAGEFVMGKDEDLIGDDSPRHTVYLDTYWIDQTDITNAMYAKCVQAGKCKFNIQHAQTAVHYNDPDYANHPVVYVTWYQAVAYCGWAGRRLPSEAEWEKGARGTDGRTFPWGKTAANSSLANYNDAIGDTTPVGSYPLGASPYGLLDMAGNVRQWVADWFDALFYRNSPLQNPLGPGLGVKRVLRGGSFKDPANGVRVTTRFEHEPGSAGMNRGFRCAISP
jgi:eukaryotic-like serine/threonine-protein kinase